MSNGTGTTFEQLLARGEMASAELDALWASLPTVRVDEILGRWKGGDFGPGHPTHELLKASKWYGKTFNSAEDAKPLIRYDEDGRLFSDTETAHGEASLWEVEFRGEVTATMVYDGWPVLDHFKRIDQRTLLGVMNGKSNRVLFEGKLYYFFLELVGDAS
ncbi:DUF4334 domain-containing protein [Psychromicrobium lacuslunae]|uniref:DUF4334 domain-containing protein n=1 Tax=Psychromicrobium lacuslunae TaxID=1618207 RepID=A0A0D4C188_9MICC|nr:DUF4334 domain-containing protein [Psychromicrobium lacuslunae]AJT42457.1 hypothetical protein UM93_14880 [Psychromicrobium lacuslunae]